MSSKLLIFSKFFLLMIIISFAGWLFEVIQVSILAGELVDRGFLSLPICPIYGVTLLIIYFLIGTPKKPQGILKKIETPLFLYLSYFLMAFLIPLISELVVGFFFDKVFNLRLWDYSHWPLNINGYVCLEIALLWAIGITLIMRFVFTPFKKIVFKFYDLETIVLTISLIILIIGDTIYNILNLIYR